MKPIEEHINMDQFDREYSLADLFPLARARELLAEIDGRTQAIILHPDGRVHYGANDTDMEDYASFLQQHPSWPDAAWVDDRHRRHLRFDLIHEMEIIGILILIVPKESMDSMDRLLHLGRFTAGFVNRMIDLNHRNRMTAGLHGQVVNESYTQLMKKADQLARSEERYRRLAESLEIEVEKKTREVRETQMALLQQEKMAAIGQLAAGMAHEINNPMGFIISNLNTLRGSTDELSRLIVHYRNLTDLLEKPAGEARAVSQIREQMASIDRLIHEMDLDFVIKDTQSLIEESLDGAKRVKIIVENLRDFTHPSVDTIENVNLNDCLDITLAMLSSHRSPDVTVLRHYGDIPEIACHLREINQVLFNILKNAFQAVGNQGEIVLDSKKEADRVMIRISDTGVGIPASDLGTIFDPFFTTREVGEGTGLGLFHAYNTIKALGGTLTAESQVGHGSAFTIRIPLTGSDPAEDDGKTSETTKDI
ncbi:hypothetical protein DSCO28_34790 [Desulfosarcina ovata subsp. sediminis]|uniref:histidine kinase n=1 Tax=Desulfosarcina ovata subsp. sediminis TaxID=885957 RepID=A0A5K7ZRV2_9BACT|nr:ATP-binding protein [Desulfosarcina ovata]BBO82913.1 hypothetical protein DSCO28_34790 [Desulfosarcina ovata subsp. sediminis]